MYVERVLQRHAAAHLFTPMGGLGYNTAVEDAVIRPDQTVAWRGDNFAEAAAIVNVVRGAGGV